MFRFIRRLFSKLFSRRAYGRIPLRKPARGSGHSYRKAGQEDAEKSAARDLLQIGGLAILITAMMYGGIYGGLFLTRLQDRKSEIMKTVIEYQVAGQKDKAIEASKKAANLEYKMALFSSGHGHLSLLSLISLVLGGCITQRTRLGERWQTTAAVTVLAGAVLMPAGVVLEAVVNKILGMLISAAGGAGVIAGLFVFLWGMIKYKLAKKQLQ